MGIHDLISNRRERAARVVAAGDVVHPDGWPLASRLVAATDDLAPFRLPSGRYTDVAYPVRIEVTGREPRRRGGEHWLRVRITFVHDGEPEVVSGGWVNAW